MSKSPKKHRKSFIDVNIEQCSSSSKIRAMKKHEDSKKRMKNFRLEEKVEVMYQGRAKLYPGKLLKLISMATSMSSTTMETKSIMCQ